MKFVLDASVAVAASRPNEPSHAVSPARVARVLAGHDEIVVPAIFPIEVGASLARVGEPTAAVCAYVDTLMSIAVAVATIGATAFTAQGRSDWEVYRLLEQRPELPPCHALHYLQMPSEKIAKAYRCRDTSASLDELGCARLERGRSSWYTSSMGSDVTCSPSAPSPTSDETGAPGSSSPPSAPVALVDSLLRSVLSGAQGRVEQDRAQARAAGLIDAEGHLLTDRWPDDMRPDSRASVETG